MSDERSESSDQHDLNDELEKKKLDLELEKLQVEKYKARWSAISAITPIVVALATIASTVGYGAWSLNQTAKVQFGTKVVEVAMQNSRNEEDSIARAKLMGKMFEEYVPNDFKERLDKINLWKDFHLLPRDWQYEPKNMVLNLMAEHPDQKKFILDAIEKLYPGDTWPRDLQDLMPAKPEVRGKGKLEPPGAVR